MTIAGRIYQTIKVFYIRDVILNSMENKPLGIIRSSNKALTVTSKNFTELRKQITSVYNSRVEKLKELRSAKTKLALLTLIFVASYPLIFGFFIKVSLYHARPSKTGWLN